MGQARGEGVRRCLVACVTAGALAWPVTASAARGGVGPASEGDVEEPADVAADDGANESGPPDEAGTDEAAPDDDGGSAGDDEARGDDDDADDDDADDGDDDGGDDDEADDDDDDDGAASAGRDGDAPSTGGGNDLPPLSTLQRAGWWTLFAGFTVGSVAGVFAGLAERQEDGARRLANQFDLEAGAQPVYADVQQDYEQYLDRGEAYAKTAIALGVVTAAAAIAGITLFAVDASRRRGPGKKRQQAKVRVFMGGSTMRVRF